MEGNPSSATAGLRSTLHRFLPTPEKNTKDHKEENDLEDRVPDPDMAPVSIDLHYYGPNNDGSREEPEGSEAQSAKKTGAKLTSFWYKGGGRRREAKTRRKSKRMLQRNLKAKRRMGKAQK